MYFFSTGVDAVDQVGQLNITGNIRPAALYNYAFNLFYGNGVTQDKEKAKEYFIRAKDVGVTAASDFLKEHYGYVSEYRAFTYSDMGKDLTICQNEIRIDFCGLENSEGDTTFKFWISNNDKKPHQVWIKNLKVNSLSVGSITTLGVYDSEQFRYCTKSFKFSQKNNIDYIEFQIEVDDEGTTELFTVDTVKIVLLTMYR